MSRDQSFDYDALDRLTAASDVYGAVLLEHDALGNRLMRDANGVLNTYAYGATSHYLEGITGESNQSFQYDANSNTVTKDTFGFTYGRHNRLTEINLSGLVHATYTHNGRGERVKKEAGGEGVYFHYDPNGQLLAETDAQGQTLMEYLYLEGMPLAVVAMRTTKPGVYFLQGQHPRNGQPFRLTLEPQTRTLSLEKLGDIDGTYAPERWTETAEGLLASHTTPSGMRLKVKLVLTADSPSGTLTLTHSLRQARYTLNETTGSGVYGGLEEKTGKAVSLTVDEDTRTLTLHEEGQPPRTLTVDSEHWHLNQRNGAKHLRFGAEAPGLTLKGALHLGQDGRVAGHLKLRQGERQKSRYALTTRPTPSGPAGLLYIHTDHLGTPQILTDETQQVVWAADYQPFGEATLTKDNVTFNLRFPGQYFDSETRLHYNMFRYFDPMIGRYTQSNPLGFTGWYVNPYTYVENNPLNRIDPYGLFTWPSPGDVAKYWGEFGGGGKDFYDNYRAMRDAGWKDADKYFHCKANCEAAQRGPGGEDAACVISDTREWWDEHIKGYSASDSAADQSANRFGRGQGGTNSRTPCAQICDPYRPLGLPPQY